MTLGGTPTVPKVEIFSGVFFKKHLNFLQIHSGPPTTIPGTTTARLLNFVLFLRTVWANFGCFGTFWATTPKNDPLWYPNGTQS